MASLSYEDEEELQKKIIALLLSGAEKPINSKINFQKELFLLVESYPKFKKMFEFKSNRYGPYSYIAEQIVETYKDIFDIDKKGVELTHEGKVFSQKSLREMKEKNRENILLTIRLIRSIYDKLNDDEFMFLIYKTYGYTDKSDVVDSLMKNKEMIAKSIYRKGIISYKRFLELLGD